MRFEFIRAVQGAAVVVFAAALAGSAAAQSPGEAEQFSGELAPGYVPPGDVVFEEERDALLPFGETLESDLDDFDRPLNEIAGQRRRYDPGLIGGFLRRLRGAD